MRFQSRPLVMPSELNRPNMLLRQPLNGGFLALTRPTNTPIQRVNSPFDIV